MRFFNFFPHRLKVGIRRDADRALCPLVLCASSSELALAQ